MHFGLSSVKKLHICRTSQRKTFQRKFRDKLYEHHTAGLSHTRKSEINLDVGHLCSLRKPLKWGVAFSQIIRVWTIFLSLNQRTTVELANYASPFEFCQVKIPQQTGLENNEMCFSKTLSIALSVFSENIFYHTKDPVFKRFFCVNLIWWNLKGLRELANLTVMNLTVQFDDRKSLLVNSSFLV